MLLPERLVRRLMPRWPSVSRQDRASLKRRTKASLEETLPATLEEMDLLEEAQEISKKMMVACSDVTQTTNVSQENKTLATTQTVSRRVDLPLSPTQVETAAVAVEASIVVVIVMEVVASREVMEVVSTEVVTEVETETSSQEVQQLKTMVALVVSAALTLQEVIAVALVETVEAIEAVARVVAVATAMPVDSEVSAQTIMHASEQII